MGQRLGRQYYRLDFRMLSPRTSSPYTGMDAVTRVTGPVYEAVRPIFISARRSGTAARRAIVVGASARKRSRHSWVMVQATSTVWSGPSGSMRRSRDAPPMTTDRGKGRACRSFAPRVYRIISQVPRIASNVFRRSRPCMLVPLRSTPTELKLLPTRGSARPSGRGSRSRVAGPTSGRSSRTRPKFGLESPTNRVKKREAAQVAAHQRRKAAGPAAR